MAGVNDDRWLSETDLNTVFAMLQNNGVTEVLYKVLPKNANSKNQVYLGGKDPSQFSKLPSGEMSAHVSVSEKSGKQVAVFRADLDFYWLTSEGNLAPAPNAKMIFYPQYPEVRFSGFLLGCKKAPTTLWTKEKRGNEPGRILLLGVGNGKKIIGVTLPPEAPATQQILQSRPHAPYEVLSILPMPGQSQVDGLHDLMQALCRIHNRDWVKSMRLNSNGEEVKCEASNCNGNTLEALLGIRSNGFSKPDFMGWEVKARQVKNADKPNNTVVTLFTPEPTSGAYVDDGIEAYIRRFGYPDRNGRRDRLNVGGVYRASEASHHHLTKLKLVLDGFDAETMSYSPTGAILLVDDQDNLAAGWPFAKLMDHWKEKHAHAAFVPVQQRLDPFRQYRYGRNILLGEGAEFKLLLNALHEGKVYYDPGIKLEDISTDRPKWKKRSQFRVNSKDLGSLYLTNRIVDACDLSKTSSAIRTSTHSVTNHESTT